MATGLLVLPSPPRKHQRRHDDPAAAASPISRVAVIFHLIIVRINIDRKTNSHRNNSKKTLRHPPTPPAARSCHPRFCSSHHILQVDPRSHHLARKSCHACCFIYISSIMMMTLLASAISVVAAALFVFVCLCLFVLCLCLYCIFVSLSVSVCLLFISFLYFF